MIIYENITINFRGFLGNNDSQRLPSRRRKGRLCDWLL